MTRSTHRLIFRTQKHHKQQKLGRFGREDSRGRRAWGDAEVGIASTDAVVFPLAGRFRVRTGCLKERDVPGNPAGVVAGPVRMRTREDGGRKVDLPALTRCSVEGPWTSGRQPAGKGSRCRRRKRGCGWSAGWPLFAVVSGPSSPGSAGNFSWAWLGRDGGSLHLHRVDWALVRNATVQARLPKRHAAKIARFFFWESCLSGDPSRRALPRPRSRSSLLALARLALAGPLSFVPASCRRLRRVFYLAGLPSTFSSFSPFPSSLWQPSR
jgi:hypothetical protein